MTKYPKAKSAAAKPEAKKASRPIESKEHGTDRIAAAAVVTAMTITGLFFLLLSVCRASSVLFSRTAILLRMGFSPLFRRQRRKTSTSIIA